jgi:hypothetical protein
LKAYFAAAACAVLVCACTQQKPAPKAEAAAVQPKYNTSLPMDELMGHVVDPASFVYWKGAGTEETAKGTHSLAPTTDEGWENLESAAATLIEAGNMLQLPGRARAPEADWNRYAQQLTDLAIPAKAAAQKHDEKAVYDLGAKIYQVCTACHEEYVIQPQLKANGPPQGALPDLPPDVRAKIAQYKKQHD